MTGRFVLGSCALIGYLENEPFADHIEKYLKQAKRAEASLICMPSTLERSITSRSGSRGRTRRDLAYACIKAFPLTFVDKIDEELLLKAATIKAGYSISYADSFAAALANIHNCALLTGDPELKILEKESIISIVWLTG